MVAVGQVVTGGGAPHTHGWTEITGEPDFALASDVTTALAGKASAGHAHTAPAWSEVTGKPATFPPEAHVQGWDTITGKPDLATAADVTALDGRVDALEVAPPTHTHPWADITGEPNFALAADVTALDGRVDALEAAPAPPVLMRRWNGAAYVEAPDARIFVGAGDPGVMPEGSIWIGPE